MNKTASVIGRALAAIMVLAMAAAVVMASGAPKPNGRPAQDRAGDQGPDRLVAAWPFDRVADRKTADSRGGIDDAVSGNFRLVHGLRGEALVLDGYTTVVARAAAQAPRLGPDFTIEAWIALGAYPWNWAPIAARENTVSLASNLDAATWPEDITVNSPRAGFFFGVGPAGELGFMAGAGGWIDCRTEARLPLRAWTHVAAVFRGGQGVALYIDGRMAAEAPARGAIRLPDAEDLRIGMPRQKIEPSHPVRAFATLATWYGLDGLLDELRIHGAALAPDEIAASIAATAAAASAAAMTPGPAGAPPRSSGARPPALPAPDLAPRVLPSGPPGPGVFGASYMNLRYYPEWDALWPVSQDPDVVVQFDGSPVRVVFWRGTRYSPAWVMENGIWMADQSAENFNNDDGCIEHMLDPRCRFSHVRIVENTDARVVVHWRYCPVSANGNHSQVDPVTGWEDWVDEYYAFYPDQVGVRKVVQHTKGKPLGPEEVIGLCHPGQRPEDVMELSAMTLVNLKGQSHTYTWAERSPQLNEGNRYLHFGDGPEDRPVIIRVNTKSRIRPFQVFETGNRVRIFGIEMRPGVSHFPWWNHWPVAQIPSDGRYCQAPDRASHFSLAWGGPPSHKGDGDYYWWAWLYGASDGPAESLVPLSRAWLMPPAITVAAAESGPNAAHAGVPEARYDLTQRCYVVSPGEANPPALTIGLEGGAGSPVHNPAFVIENWGNRGAALRIEGREIPRGADFRFGHVRRINSYDLVVWVKMDSAAPTTLELTAK